MALLNIRTEGDEILRKKCRPVEEITPRVLQLLDDMREALRHANGAGLAAPQVGVLKRIAIVDDGGEIIELINPVITESSGEQTGPEGCLSLPGEYGEVTRPMNVTVTALDRNGKIFTCKREGFVARAFCHETDHLDGILYIDKAERMLDPEDFES